MKTEIILPTLPGSRIHISPVYNCPAGEFHGWHIHSECEIFLSIGCTKIFRANNQEYVLEPGDIIFINERIPHMSDTAKCGYEFLIQMSTDFSVDFQSAPPYRYLNRLGNEVALFKAGSPVNLILREQFEEIIRENQDQKPSYEKFIKSCICKILAVLYRNGTLPESPLDNKELRRIQPALDYVENHYAEPVTLDYATSLLHVDKSHFCRIFKQFTGFSFMEYVNFIRICNAEKLLVTTKKSIAQISEEVGFSSPSYFSEIFKKHLSYPPTFYRKTKQV